MPEEHRSQAVTDPFCEALCLTDISMRQRRHRISVQKHPLAQMLYFVQYWLCYNVMRVDLGIQLTPVVLFGIVEEMKGNYASLAR
mmetsp:Transcript_11174/g.22869  ORF Transcript_11174/g.22869 Transcript_11174/m.22869 type:complete len:85 (+) Transcript_11174:861-1115(+)